MIRLGCSPEEVPSHFLMGRFQLPDWPGGWPFEENQI